MLVLTTTRETKLGCPQHLLPLESQAGWPPSHFQPLFFPAETTSPNMDVAWYRIFNTKTLHPGIATITPCSSFPEWTEEILFTNAYYVLLVFKVHLKGKQRLKGDLMSLTCTNSSGRRTRGVVQPCWHSPFSVQDFYISRQMQSMETCLAPSHLTPDMLMPLNCISWFWFHKDSPTKFHQASQVKA